MNNEKLKYWYNEVEACVDDEIIPDEVQEIHENLFLSGTTGHFMNYVVTLNDKDGITAEIRYDKDFEDNLKIDTATAIALSNLVINNLRRTVKEKFPNCIVFTEQTGDGDDWELFIKLFIPGDYDARTSKEAENAFYEIVLETEKPYL